MDLCRNCPFADFTHKNKDLIDIYQYFQSFCIDEGNQIFSEEESLRGVYCIREGNCLVFKCCSNGNEQMINLVTRGEVLGIRSVINEEQTNLGARVITQLKGCFIPKSVFFQLLNEHPIFTRFIVNKLAEYVKNTDDKIISLRQKNIRQKTAELLLKLSIYFPENAEGYIQVNMTRKDMANLLGMATESLIRALSHFNGKKLIKCRGRKIKIVNIQKLEQISKGI